MWETHSATLAHARLFLFFFTWWSTNTTRLLSVLSELTYKGSTNLAPRSVDKAFVEFLVLFLWAIVRYTSLFSFFFSFLFVFKYITVWSLLRLEQYSKPKWIKKSYSSSFFGVSSPPPLSILFQIWHLRIHVFLRSSLSVQWKEHLLPVCLAQTQVMTFSKQDLKAVMKDRH